MRHLGKFLATSDAVVRGDFDSMHIIERVYLPDIEMYAIVAEAPIFMEIHPHMPVPEYKVWVDGNGNVCSEITSGRY